MNIDSRTGIKHPTVLNVSTFKPSYFSEPCKLGYVSLPELKLLRGAMSSVLSVSYLVTIMGYGRNTEVELLLLLF